MNKMRHPMTGVCACALAFLTSCGAMRGQTRFVETNTMTLAQAICEVQNALIATRRYDPRDRAGLTPQDVTVVLALSAMEKDGSSIGVKLPVGVAEWNAGASSATERGITNTMTLKFVNPLFVQTNTVWGDSILKAELKPEQLAEAIGLITTHRVPDGANWGAKFGNRPLGDKPPSQPDCTMLGGSK